MSHRIAFNPDLPLVAGTDFNAGGTQIRVGDAFDWRGLGVSEQIVVDFWRSGMVNHPLTAAPEPEAKFTPKAIDAPVKPEDNHPAAPKRHKR